MGNQLARCGPPVFSLPSPPLPLFDRVSFRGCAPLQEQVIRYNREMRAFSFSLSPGVFNPQQVIFFPRLTPFPPIFANSFHFPCHLFDVCSNWPALLLLLSSFIFFIGHFAYWSLFNRNKMLRGLMGVFFTPPHPFLTVVFLAVTAPAKPRRYWYFWEITII